MTQFDQDPYANEIEPQPTGSNPLGIVGFVLSILCVTSPIGLLVSILALFKAPRGFAIAGVIIGAIFSVIVGIFAWGAFMVWPYMADSVEITTDFKELEQEVESYRASNNDELPTSVDQLSWDNTDPWGNPYIYSIDQENNTWTIVSTGPDGQEGTDDDFSLDSTMDQMDVQTEISEWIEERAKKDFGQNP